MTFEILDQILGIYLTALAQGLAVLQTYSLGILGVFAIAAWCTNLWGPMMSGGNGLAAGITSVFSIGLWYWVSVSLAAMGIAAFDTFTQFGASVGGVTTPGTFLIPSQVWAMGWEAARPLLQFAQRFSGWSVLWNLFNIAIAYASVLVIILAFGIMSFFVMLVQIEFRLNLMLGAVLIPLGVYQGTAFMAEFGLGLLCGGLIRTFITTALLAISVPLAHLVTPQLGPGGDPTFETAVVMAFVSAIYIGLLITTARKASAIAVRGMGLGIGSEAFSLRNLATAASMALGPAGRAVGGAIQGGSRLLNGR